EKCYITINWPRNTRISINIYKLNGSRVYETNLNVTKQTPLNWEWDGQSSSGEKLPQGIYLIEINDGNKKEIHKLMHLSLTM
ncbi:FlgD immunoglobulin-like domain containing protein, partial [Arthrospira platensis SPKY1]|nr:FlgD immunoglobulin-like domain containing protein [Arthrospira platensis SPKY1]